MSECPTCGNEYSTETGMKRHHTISHGESLTKITVACDNCGKEVEKNTYDIAKTDNIYCDHDCYVEDKSRDPIKVRECEGCEKEFEADKTTSGYKKYCSEECKVNTEECDTCGTEFKRKPSHVRENNYCSKDCMRKARKSSYTGKDNPNYQGGINSQEFVCNICGDTFIGKAASNPKYCSRECANEALRSDNHVGGERPSRRYYGSNWQEQRVKAIIDDLGRCRVCGMTDPEHRVEHGVSIHVHHIRPFGTFLNKETGRFDTERANRVDNLVTLCHSCHRRWEGIPVIPE